VRPLDHTEIEERQWIPGSIAKTAFGLAAALLASSVPCALAQTGTVERQAYFGETHVHTSWSLDAFAIGNTLTQPRRRVQVLQGRADQNPLANDVKIDTPLDWAGVTDHSEYAGVVNLANEPGSAVSKMPAAQPLILKARTKRKWSASRSTPSTPCVRPPVKALMAPRDRGTVWKRNVDLADQANERASSRLCSYE